MKKISKLKNKEKIKQNRINHKTKLKEIHMPALGHDTRNSLLITFPGAQVLYVKSKLVLSSKVRSSYRRCSVRKGVPINFAKFTNFV